MVNLGLDRDNGFIAVGSNGFLKPLILPATLEGHTPRTDRDIDPDAWQDFDPNRTEDDLLWDVFRVDELEDDPLPEYGDFWPEDVEEGMVCRSPTNPGGFFRYFRSPLRVAYCDRLL